ncbi:fluoride efflux transporter CrcB [Promicromonospora soli]
MITLSMGVLVAVGGGLGAAARFLVDTMIARHNRWSVPLGTLTINVTACLLLGMLTGLALAHPGHDGLHVVLAVGFLGGYSTFSTASVECARLLLAGRGPIAALQAVGMLVGSVAAAVVGLMVIGGLAG